MATKMHAAVVTGFGQRLAFPEWPTPEPGLGQVLVKTGAVGVCRPGLHPDIRDWPLKPTLPFIPGHEGMGRVAAPGVGINGHFEHCPQAWKILGGQARKFSVGTP